MPLLPFRGIGYVYTILYIYIWQQSPPHQFSLCQYQMPSTPPPPHTDDETDDGSGVRAPAQATPLLQFSPGQLFYTPHKNTEAKRLSARVRSSFILATTHPPVSDHAECQSLAAAARSFDRLCRRKRYLIVTVAAATAVTSACRPHSSSMITYMYIIIITILLLYILYNNNILSVSFTLTSA